MSIRSGLNLLRSTYQLINSRKGEHLDAGRSAWANVHRCATALTLFWEGWYLVHGTHPFLVYNIAQEAGGFKMGFCIKWTKDSCEKGRICFGKEVKRWQDSWGVVSCFRRRSLGPLFRFPEPRRVSPLQRRNCVTHKNKVTLDRRNDQGLLRILII